MTKFRFFSHVLWFGAFVLACCAVFVYLFGVSDIVAQNNLLGEDEPVFGKPEKSVFILIALSVFLFTIGFGLRIHDHSKPRSVV